MPERLSLDEFSKKKGNRKFATVVTDIDKGSLLEVIDSHQSDDIIEVLRAQPQDMREKHIQGICNYFANRTTSGVMEGINNKIKLIIRQSYGFNTFKSLREKLLACLFK